MIQSVVRYMIQIIIVLEEISKELNVVILGLLGKSKLHHNHIIINTFIIGHLHLLLYLSSFVFHVLLYSCAVAVSVAVFL